MEANYAAAAQEVVRLQAEMTALVAERDRLLADKAELLGDKEAAGKVAEEAAAEVSMLKAQAEDQQVKVLQLENEAKELAATKVG